MKNIVFVIADMKMGGAQRVVSLLASRWVKQGRHIHIVTMGGHGQESFFQLADNVTIHPLQTNGASTNFLSAIYSNLRRIKLLRKTTTKLDPDVVVCFQTETNCICLLAMALTKFPVIISERSDPYIYPQSKIWRILRSAVYPLARGAVFQTNHAANFFGETIKNKTVIFNPVNRDMDKSGPTPDRPYILGVGRLSHEKGFDSLISAHAEARRICKDLKLVLVGEGSQKTELENLASRLGSREHVIFASSQTRLAAYYDSALAFVLPSRFEGLPNALLEAMAHGCVVISTPLFAAAAEIITHGHNGLIAASESPSALAEEVVKIYGNSMMCEELRRQALESAKRFESDAICTAWLDFIDKHSR